VKPRSTRRNLLRTAIQKARQAIAPATKDQLAEFERALDQSVRRRQEFWIDTCRDPMQMQIRSAQIWELYMKHGCRFTEPTHLQVQEVFDALDSALPLWDRDHPELFYQTVELNFPELHRHL
jgi:hypothetical protein